MRDTATVLITLFPRVDDTLKGSAMIQQALKRPVPAPHLSDSEVIPLALSQELIGEPREDHVFRLHQSPVRSFFPALNEGSRSNRRTRDLWAVILAVRISVQFVLEALELEETAAIDSAPVPCVSDTRGQGVCDGVGTADDGVSRSKASKDVGYQRHRVISLTGLILGFRLTPANCSDNQPVVEVLDSFSPHLTLLLGDGASHDAALQSSLEQHRSLKHLGLDDPHRCSDHCSSCRSARQLLFRQARSSVSGSCRLTHSHIASLSETSAT